MTTVIIILAHVALFGVPAWIGYTKLSDWAYDGPYPADDGSYPLGATIRDENGKLWIYSTDMVASCLWRPGHLWAHIRERHNRARAFAEGGADV